jgi:hypothetical protein
VAQKAQSRWPSIILIAVLAFFAGGPLVQADGYVIPEPMPSSSIMADQKAVLVFHDGHENLVISIDLDLRSVEDLPDMAWVIPVPSLPEVQVTSQALFDELDRLSAPEVVYRSERQGGFSLGLRAEAPAPAVEVLERKQVGVYDVAVLAGRDGGALRDWLNAEGFRIPDALLPTLEAYIAEQWTFVAMRIAPDVNRNEIFRADPVWLSFETEEMVYPMRLTGIREDPLALRLYILADHRYEMEGFTVEFAGTVQVSAADPNLEAVLNREYFLTKLFDPAVTPAQMANDFYPHQAPTDEPYRERVVQTYVSSGPAVGMADLAVLCGACWLGLAALLVVTIVVIWLLRRRT